MIKLEKRYLNNSIVDLISLFSSTKQQLNEQFLFEINNISTINEISDFKSILVDLLKESKEKISIYIKKLEAPPSVKIETAQPDTLSIGSNIVPQISSSSLNDDVDGENITFSNKSNHVSETSSLLNTKENVDVCIKNAKDTNPENKNLVIESTGGEEFENEEIIQLCDTINTKRSDSVLQVTSHSNKSLDTVKKTSSFVDCIVLDDSDDDETYIETSQVKLEKNVSSQNSKCSDIFIPSIDSTNIPDSLLLDKTGEMRLDSKKSTEKSLEAANQHIVSTEPPTECSEKGLEDLSELAEKELSKGKSTEKEKKGIVINSQKIMNFIESNSEKFQDTPTSISDFNIYNYNKATFGPVITDSIDRSKKVIDYLNSMSEQHEITSMSSQPATPMFFFDDMEMSSQVDDDEMSAISKIRNIDGNGIKKKQTKDKAKSMQTVNKSVPVETETLDPKINTQENPRVINENNAQEDKFVKNEENKENSPNFSLNSKELINTNKILPAAPPTDIIFDSQTEKTKRHYDVITLTSESSNIVNKTINTNIQDEKNSSSQSGGLQNINCKSNVSVNQCQDVSENNGNKNHDKSQSNIIHCQSNEYEIQIDSVSQIKQSSRNLENINEEGSQSQQSECLFLNTGEVSECEMSKEEDSLSIVRQSLLQKRPQINSSKTSESSTEIVATQKIEKALSDNDDTEIVEIYNSIDSLLNDCSSNITVDVNENIQKNLKEKAKNSEYTVLKETIDIAPSNEIQSNLTFEKDVVFSIQKLNDEVPNTKKSDDSNEKTDNKSHKTIFATNKSDEHLSTNRKYSQEKKNKKESSKSSNDNGLNFDPERKEIKQESLTIIDFHCSNSFSNQSLLETNYNLSQSGNFHMEQFDNDIPTIKEECNYKPDDISEIIYSVKVECNDDTDAISEIIPSVKVECVLDEDSTSNNSSGDIDGSNTPKNIRNEESHFLNSLCTPSDMTNRNISPETLERLPFANKKSRKSSENSKSSRMSQEINKLTNLNSLSKMKTPSKQRTVKRTVRKKKRPEILDFLDTSDTSLCNNEKDAHENIKIKAMKRRHLQLSEDLAKRQLLADSDSDNELLDEASTLESQLKKKATNVCSSNKTKECPNISVPTNVDCSNKTMECPKKSAPGWKKDPLLNFSLSVKKHAKQDNEEDDLLSVCSALQEKVSDQRVRKNLEKLVENPEIVSQIIVISDSEEEDDEIHVSTHNLVGDEDEMVSNKHELDETNESILSQKFKETARDRKSSFPSRKKKVSKQPSRQDSCINFPEEENYSDVDPIILHRDDSSGDFVSLHHFFAKYLKDHQIRGVKFMWDTCFGSALKLQTEEGQGCILAHDMGLGKSLQVIALLHTLKHTISNTKVLILSPKSLVQNWADEINKWTQRVSPKLDVFSWNIDKVESVVNLHKWACQGGVYLLGYELFMNLCKNKDKYGGFDPTAFFLNPGPDVVICDEAHLLKNCKTEKYKYLQKIQTKRRIALTGTPIQNNLEELYNLVHLVQPNFMSKTDFFDKFVKPISVGQNKTASRYQKGMATRQINDLHKQLEKIMDREEGSNQELGLPPKLDYDLFLNLTDVQKKLYKFFSDRMRLCFVQSMIFTVVSIAENMCIHPKSLEKLKRIEEFSNGKDWQEIQSRGVDWHHELKGDWWKSVLSENDKINFHAVEAGVKLKVTFQIIDLAQQCNDKVLVFCNSLEVLNIMETMLANRSYQKNVNYFRLDGKVPPKDRPKYIKIFNDEKNTDAKVFLLTHRVGGMGLNFTGGNRIIILDMPWNPSYHEQSSKRTHRIGQKKTSFVYRLITRGTLEEKIYKTTVSKQSLTKRVVDKMKIKALAREQDIFNFVYEEDTSSKESLPTAKDDLLNKLFSSDKENIFHSYKEQGELFEVSEEVFNEFLAYEDYTTNFQPERKRRKKKQIDAIDQMLHQDGDFPIPFNIKNRQPYSANLLNNSIPNAAQGPPPQTSALNLSRRRSCPPPLIPIPDIDFVEPSTPPRANKITSLKDKIIRIVQENRQNLQRYNGSQNPSSMCLPQRPNQSLVQLERRVQNPLEYSLSQHHLQSSMRQIPQPQQDLFAQSYMQHTQEPGQQNSINNGTTIQQNFNLPLPQYSQRASVVNNPNPLHENSQDNLLQNAIELLAHPHVQNSRVNPVINPPVFAAATLQIGGNALPINSQNIDSFLENGLFRDIDFMNCLSEIIYSMKPSENE